MNIEFSRAKTLNQTMVPNYRKDEYKFNNKKRQDGIEYYESLIKYFGAPAQCNDCACGLVY